MTKKSLTNTNLSFICGNVNFSIPENALADTLRYRVPYVSTPRRKFERFKLNNSFVRVARHPPCDANGWHGRNDIQISVAKYLSGGENNQVEFNDYRRRDYEKRHTIIFADLQADIIKASGINFNIFDSQWSRYHVALNLQCKSFADAEKLRDYWFESVNLRYLPVKRRHKTTCYWNCRSYDGTGKPNQCFAVYPTGKDKLRLEYRRNNSQSVAGLIKSSIAKSLTLENNFRCLSQPETMNAVFWHTARHFFTADEQKKLLAHYRL